ncbi:MAG: DNA polymerase III subunit delta [Bacteroidetes bacterium CHB5]|nr:DNA polymerase III subunit delta [Bacteroidetes bacterium CHB5]
MDSGAKKILDKLKSRKYDPVYVLQGEEPYYIDLISNYIEANVLSDSEKSFNQVVLYGKDVTINNILTHARRFPMMAERQVVIVKEAQEILDLNKETGAKQLLDYLQNPVPTTLLVLCHKHKTIDKRRELGKKLDKLTEGATFKKPKDSELTSFIMEYNSGKGLNMDDRAVQVLAEYVGNDLNRLANEIDKIRINTESGQAITADLVMAQVGISREYNIFELQKALIRKDRLQAAKIVNFFEANTKRNPVIPMVAFLYSFFSKVLIASTSPDRSASGIATFLNINRYFVSNYSDTLRNYTHTQIITTLSLLKQADLKLKGVDAGDATDGQILRELVLRMML